MDNKFFATKEAHLNFRETFRARAHKKEFSSASYFLLRNICLTRDIKNGFSPATNKNKLSNGYRPWYAIEDAKRQLLSWIRWNPTHLKELYLTDADLEKLMVILNGYV